MKRIAIVIAVFIIVGCSSKGREVTNDSYSQFDSSNAVSNEEHRDTLIVQENLLDGSWGTEGSENATMLIRKNSIYYVDSNQTFKYDLQSDTIRIYYDDWTYEGIVKTLTKDSLVIVDADSKSIFIRFNK